MPKRIRLVIRALPDHNLCLLDIKSKINKMEDIQLKTYLSLFLERSVGSIPSIKLSNH